MKLKRLKDLIKTSSETSPAPWLWAPNVGQPWEEEVVFSSDGKKVVSPSTRASNCDLELIADMRNSIGALVALASFVDEHRADIFFSSGDDKELRDRLGMLLDFVK